MKPLKTTAPKAPNTEIVRVEAQSLFVHPEAQKKLVPAKVKQIAANLDLDAIGVFHAVRYERNGKHGLWLIDGQTRRQALIDVGFGEWLVCVQVHLDVKDDARASQLFLELGHRSAISPFDQFANEVRARHPDAVGVVGAAEAHGLKVERGTGDGKVCCVNALKNLWNIDGGQSLNRALDVITTAWGRSAAALEGKLIEGIGLVCSTYDGSLDGPALTKKLAKYHGGASGLLGVAKGLRDVRKATLSRCIAETVVEAYNTGRRSGRLDPL